LLPVAPKIASPSLFAASGEKGEKGDFLGRLGDLVAQTQTDCFAWALIDNHAHLIFRTRLTL